ncbi:MAG: hypothetical protein K2P81_05430 [Bacteriovoracaceae bacterium]|nr:hypothetical protein [Bacteriovoracaceae bacterium]
MTNSSSSAPEHDEKTGSFAPRTSGQQEEPRKPKSFKPSKKTLTIILAFICVTGLLVWKFWYLPKLENDRNNNYPARELFAQIERINEIETLEGQGAAAEPLLEMRLALEGQIKKSQSRFPNLNTIITPCVLSEHDFHLIDSTGRILTHFMIEEEMPEDLADFRDWYGLQKFQSPPVILKMAHEYLAFNSQGDLLPTTSSRP